MTFTPRPKFRNQAISMLMKSAGASMAEYDDPICHDAIVQERRGGLPLTIREKRHWETKVKCGRSIFVK